MSATRDKNQRIAFVYSNLYQIYRKGKDAAQSAQVETPDRSAVIKTGFKTHSVKTEVAQQMKVDAYRPVEFLRTPLTQVPVKEERPTPVIKTPAQPPAHAPAPHAALENLKKNLGDLQDLHERLKFLLTELEDLSKE